MDVDDLSLLIQSFDFSVGDEGYRFEADFNGDGTVEVNDLSLLIRNFDAEGDP